MTNDTHSRTKRDLAYACFIPPGLVSLGTAVASYIRLDTGTAGGLGLLVFVPLTMFALVTVPIGIFYAIRLRRDIALLVISGLTILRFVQIVTEFGSATLHNVSGLLYGITVVGLITLWFAVRRRSADSV